MNLVTKLNGKKKSILDKWYDVTAKSYSNDTYGFLKNRGNSFANPVAHTIFCSLGNLLNRLIDGSSIESFKSDIDSILRIRAVQDFKPSEAVSFIFELKKIVRHYLSIEDNIEFLILFESKIDILAMSAFDSYMAFREEVYELKANEARNQFFGSLRRANLIVDA